MANCKECKYCVTYPTGEGESFWGHSYASDIEYESECGKGYKRFDLNNEINCKRYKLRGDN